MNILSSFGDILLCQIDRTYVVYQKDHEYFIGRNKTHAEEEFKNLIECSEYYNNER